MSRRDKIDVKDIYTCEFAKILHPVFMKALIQFINSGIVTITPQDDTFNGLDVSQVEFVENLPAKPWALTGKTEDRKQNILMSLKLSGVDGELNAHTKKLFENYAKIQDNETMSESFMCEDADFVLAYYKRNNLCCQQTYSNHIQLFRKTYSDR